MSRFIDVYTDFGFKKLFGEEYSAPYLISFLNGVIERPAPIEKVDLNSTLEVRHIEALPSCVFEVHCTDTDGKEFIVLMHNGKEDDLHDRILFYSMQGYAHQFELAEKANFEMPANFWKSPSPVVIKRPLTVYSITLINFNRAPGIAPYGQVVSRFAFMCGDTEMFTEQLQMYVVEVPLFNKPLAELESDSDRWFYFLRHLESFESLPEALNIPVLQSAFERLQVN
jgi:predicted transposase/invertase (TIGR01784 family)